jgi:hypothetical protein
MFSSTLSYEPYLYPDMAGAEVFAQSTNRIQLMGSRTVAQVWTPAT